jgi:hypothetical protein
MALLFSDLTLNASGQITIPVDNNVTRTGKGSELTWLEHESTHRDAMVRNFNLVSNTGNTDNLIEILGGHEGSHVLLRPKAGHTITLVDSATLRIDPGNVLTLSQVWHCVLFVCIGANLYAKPI